MAEFAGLAYYAEVPGVIWDIQRVGPIDRLAHAHFAGRHSFNRVPFARRYQEHFARLAPWLSVSPWRRTLSIWPSNSKLLVFVMSDLDLG